MTGRLAGKVAFITGIARGQGRAHAVRMAQEGADIIGIDILEPIPSQAYAMGTPQELAETVRLVEALDRRIVATKADVRDRDGVAAAVRDGIAALGRLDIVVASAAVSPPAFRLQDTPPQVWQDVLDINLTGVWNTLSATLPILVKGKRGGSVIVISSGAGLKGVPNLSSYSAAKAAVVTLAKSAANEVAHAGVRVNVIAPGTVNTPMVTENVQQFRVFRPDLPEPTLDDCVDLFTGMNPMGLPWIEPVEIANAALFLASDEARYITGIVMPVDQGNAAKP